MKKIFTFILMMIWLQSLITAQINIQSEKIVTDFVNLKEITVKENITKGIINDHIRVVNTNSKSGLIWEASADWAICKSVYISDDTYNSFIGWHTNDEAWAYFGETNNVPLWVYDIEGAEELPHDMTSDGTYMVGGTGNTIYGFDPSSGTPDWTYTITNSGDDIFNIVISNDGETVYYVSGDDYDYSYITSVDISTSTENWSFSLPEGGYGVQLILSANDERLLIEKYYNTIVYSNNGDLLFDITRVTGTGATPAISNDGNIFIIGDYHGYATVYEYNSTNQTYDEKWQYLFDGGANYDWVIAIAVSGDGSTIALGSLRFEGDGVYSGELAVFDKESNEPLWIYQSVYSKVNAIDLSEDGSIIAAASWGPVNDDDDDFWLFNRNSNEAFFAFSCQGSPYDIDLSNDGLKCIVGGKAVHAGEMGHGGKLYYFDISPPLPSVSGTVTDIDTDEPIEGAVITLGTSYSDTTSSSGFYNIEEVEAGTYTLTCELAGYETYTTEIDVEGTEIIDIEFQNLLLPPTDLQYTVTTPDVILQWEVPVTGAVVSGYKVYRNSGFLAETDTETYTDSVAAGTYTYYVTAMYADNESVSSNEVVVEVTGIDNSFALQKNVSVTNYPNPFGSETTIEFIIGITDNTEITIYNVKGRKVKTLIDKYIQAGKHSVIWDGTNENGIPAVSGIYFYRLKTDDNIILRKMIMTK